MKQHTTPLARALSIFGHPMLVLPAVIFLLALFIYPFLYGLWLSFNPKAAGAPIELPEVHIRGDADAEYRCIGGVIFTAATVKIPTIE